MYVDRGLGHLPRAGEGFLEFITVYKTVYNNIFNLFPLNRL